MSKHRKPGNSKPNPNPDDSGGEKEKNSITSNVHVHGEIFVEASPSVALAREAADKKQETRERKKWWLEVSSFGVLTVYAFLTSVQSCQAIKSTKAAKSAADTAKDALVLDERPWVGVESVVPTHYNRYPAMQVQTLGGKTLGLEDNIQIMVDFTLRNFGRSAAQHVQIYPDLLLLLAPDSDRHNPGCKPSSGQLHT